MKLFLLKNNLLFLILLITTSFHAMATSAEELAKDPQWVASLHYNKDFFRIKKSTKIPGFYLSSEADPYKELLANLKEANQNTSYQCLFPFRAKILSRAGLWKFRAIDCTAKINWKSAFDKEKLSLAFASQYMSNPASVFGHTFLVFSPDRTYSSVHPEYLDVSISYAAEMPPKVGTFEYAVSGLGGGFQGKFFDEPIYQRIHEYSNMELRDLWMYPILATPEQIDDLLDHIFELAQKNYFDYYFLDENCSYMVLKVLEVIFPKAKLREDFPLYVIPHETIKSFQRNGLLGKGSLIPSLRTKFLEEFHDLKSIEKKEVKLAISGNSEALNTKDSVDVFITYLDKRKLEKGGVVTPTEQELYQNLLIKRSKMGPKVEKKLTYPTLDPVKSQHLFYLSAKIGARNGESFQELELRPAVHDLLDSGYGHIRHSQMRFMVPTLRHTDHDGGIRLQKFQFFNFANIVPFDSMDPIISWSFILERDHLLDQMCFDCSVTRVQVQAGVSFHLLEWLDYYFLPGIQGDVGNRLNRGYRSGPGGSTGFIFDFSEKLKLNQSFSFYYADENLRFRNALIKVGLEGSYNYLQAFAIKAGFHEIQTRPLSKNNNEISGSFVYYF